MQTPAGAHHAGRPSAEAFKVKVIEQLRRIYDVRMFVDMLNGTLQLDASNDSAAGDGASLHQHGPLLERFPRRLPVSQYIDYFISCNVSFAVHASIVFNFIEGAFARLFAKSRSFHYS